MQVVISVLILIVTIVALFDVISREDSAIRGLPKLIWILLIIIVPIAGSIVWFLVGREPGTRTPHPALGRPSTPRQQSAPPLFDAPARTDTRSTEEQLAALEREIAEQEELDRIRQLESELEERRKNGDATAADS